MIKNLQVLNPHTLFDYLDHLGAGQAEASIIPNISAETCGTFKHYFVSASLDDII